MIFTTDLKTAVNNSDIIFICVGTPTKKGGSSADLSQIYNVAKDIGSAINKFKIIITKSTVVLYCFFLDYLHWLLEFEFYPCYIQLICL